MQVVGRAPEMMALLLHRQPVEDLEAVGQVPLDEFQALAVPDFLILVGAVGAVEQ
jgi:hypothetical protein